MEKKSCLVKTKKQKTKPKFLINIEQRNQIHSIKQQISTLEQQRQNLQHEIYNLRDKIKELDHIIQNELKYLQDLNKSHPYLLQYTDIFASFQPARVEDLFKYVLLYEKPEMLPQFIDGQHVFRFKLINTSTKKQQAIAYTLTELALLDGNARRYIMNDVARWLYLDLQKMYEKIN